MNSPRFKPRRQGSSIRGFTLIEVLVALAIFALSITALSGTFHSNIHNANRLKDKTMSFWLAENELVELKAKAFAQGKYPPTTTRKDKKQYAGREWLVETAVSKAPGPFNMLRIDISVGVEGDDKPNYYSTLSGFIVVKD
ncbi:MAG: type II secretion system minor pseudopilin GspI [Pseudomonadales bacterium]|nr:type II secretion system minor pseudopilin GspI [Pseudomonadales bacterium]